MEQKTYYVKLNGEMCDISKKELQQRCLCSNNTFNKEGYLKVLAILGYEHDEVLLGKSFNGSYFELGRYLQLMNVIKGKEDEKKITLTEKVVKALDEDIDSLLGKLQSSIKGDAFSNYKMFINNLKDTVELKQSLDWKLMYSEYSTQVDSNTLQKQIAIWEQNGDGNIRNHKVWNVEEICNNR